MCPIQALVIHGVYPLEFVHSPDDPLGPGSDGFEVLVSLENGESRVTDFDCVEMLRLCDSGASAASGPRTGGPASSYCATRHRRHPKSDRKTVKFEHSINQ